MKPTNAFTTRSSSTRELLASDRSLARRRSGGGLLGHVAVAAVGGCANNVLPVDYKGTIGWAWVDYLGEPIRER